MGSHFVIHSEYLGFQQKKILAVVVGILGQKLAPILLKTFGVALVT